jgi:Orbivirus helicase VP6
MLKSEAHELEKEKPTRQINAGSTTRGNNRTQKSRQTKAGEQSTKPRRIPQKDWEKMSRDAWKAHTAAVKAWHAANPTDGSSGGGGGNANGSDGSSGANSSRWAPIVQHTTITRVAYTVRTLGSKWQQREERW